MDPIFIRQTLIDRMRRHRENVDQAALSITQGFGLDLDTVAPIVAQIRQEGRRNQLLEIPSGVTGGAYRRELIGEARLASWYTGPEEGDDFWPPLRRDLLSGNLADSFPEVDMASTKVVALLADPHVRRLKKKGLVVGYVQSGKTANYTAVMAKAADAGYRLFIVLSGMHNNLRAQTQTRIAKDLLDHQWARLTTDTEDFGTVVNGAPLLSQGVHVVAIVKKNGHRLRSLRDWLSDIPEEIRAACPALLLDDEADQATPNTRAAQDELSKINALVRQVWSELPTGSYVGYTATPFANVFMNPVDEEDLYPSDFIIDLPRADTYFGAERVFGRQALKDADTPDPGLDMVRVIPKVEADKLRPPTDAKQRAEFKPEVVGSLRDAVCWFVVASAIRRVRGEQNEHSSMLIHTTHFVAPHFAMKTTVQSLVATMEEEVRLGDCSEFENVWQAEHDRVIEIATKTSPDWSALSPIIPSVLSDIRVIVDNGYSDDRVNYSRVGEQGEPMTETLIAIGGGTLSRGLTLEGLIVSYFTRTSNTYDTLMQMGRWFGYRPGYEDLPRIWMPSGLQSDFEFLALVEEEIRLDMRRLEQMGVTPRQFGVRVRAHPGRLAITARNKMAHADVVRVSLSGKRLQTFIFDETDQEVLLANQRAARNLLSAAQLSEAAGRPTDSRWLYRDAKPSDILGFLSNYRFHPDQLGLQYELIEGWIRRVASDVPWNIVVIGSRRRFRGEDGQYIDLGTIDLGVGEDIPLVNRAPLARVPVGTANIKALLSLSDRVADINSELYVDPSPGTDADYRAIRAKHGDGRGLLIIYGISRTSVPHQAGLVAKSRRKMEAPQHLIGVGLVFPEMGDPDLSDQGDYYSVHPDWEIDAGLEEELPEDREGSASVDGAALVRGTQS